MTISQKYLEELPLNHLEAAIKVVTDAKKIIALRQHGNMDKFRQLIPFYSLLLELKQKLSMVSIPEVSFDTNVDINLSRIDSYISAYRNQVDKEITRGMVSEEINSIESIRESFRVHLGDEFAYSFTDGEIEQIQQKINTLRDFINNCKVITKDHKYRLLKRIEKLQSELHKKMSNLDRFWGLIGDAGITLGKFGKDIRPLVNDIKDIANIVWRAQTRSEGIEFKSLPKLLQNIEDVSDGQ